jgi:RHS repeat-associated protein
MTTAFGSDIFSYNNRGRMSSATVGSNATSYLYNALGQLIEKSGSSNANVYVYDEAGHILAEYDGSGNLIEETVWLGDIPVATLQPSGSSVAINYVHTDHLNTPKKVTRASDNALVWRIDQDPFGTAAPNQNPSGLGSFVYNLRFPGQSYMAETGVNYNYFRDYDPNVGRYIESDPIGLYGGINTYAYGRGNPVSIADPTGLYPCDLVPPGEFDGWNIQHGQLVSFWKCTYDCNTQCPPRMDLVKTIEVVRIGWDGFGEGCPVKMDSSYVLSAPKK